MSTKIETATYSSAVDKAPVKFRLTLKSTTELLGRVLIASLFLLSGAGKIAAYTATAGYMASVGVPGGILPLVIVTEVLASLAIILGWKTRIVSSVLMGFTLLTAVLFHSHFSDPMQVVMFLKNVSIAGAFLLLIVHGAGPLSFDGKTR